MRTGERKNEEKNTREDMLIAFHRDLCHISR
jgi:hypothetical protein